MTLRNNEKSGKSIEALADGQQCAKVKELHFVCSTPGEYEDESRRDEYEDGAVIQPDESREAYEIRCDRNTVAHLPEVVKVLLSDLTRFPNLSSLIIEFDLELEDEEKWGNYFALFVKSENQDTVVREESKWSWRALMLETWTSVAQECNRQVKTLELRRQIPRRTSAFELPHVQNFLSTVEVFKLGLWGAYAASGHRTNYLSAYLDFSRAIGYDLCDRLESVRHFELEPTEYGPLGLQGIHHAQLALKRTQMPKLEYFRLHRIFIGPELVDFLVAHVDTLQSIKLDNCMTSTGTGSMASNGIHWEELFTAVANAQPKRLRTLRVEPVDLPIEPPCPDNEEDFPHRDEIRAVLRADPNRKLFSHCVLGSKYAMLLDCEEENTLSFMRGGDQAAYDRLMLIASDNAARHSQRTAYNGHI